MDKRAFFVLVVIGAAVVVARSLIRSGRVSPENLLARIPDDAPPKWMFRNIEAIRENTDRILERLASPEEAASVVHGG